MGIKITKADRLFSQYIRKRDRWISQRCATQYHPPTTGLQCAHMFTRGKWSTRLDPRNAMALCYGCHQWVDSHHEEKEALFRKRLGDTGYEALRLKSNQPARNKQAIQEQFIAWHEERCG